MVLVKWVGWKFPTWEPRAHISPSVLAEYDAGRPYGKAVIPSLLPDPSTPLLEVTKLERDMFSKKASCNTFKEEQKRHNKVID